MCFLSKNVDKFFIISIIQINENKNMVLHKKKLLSTTNDIEIFFKNAQIHARHGIEDLCGFCGVQI